MDVIKLKILTNNKWSIYPFLPFLHLFSLLGCHQREILVGAVDHRPGGRRAGPQVLTPRPRGRDARRRTRALLPGDQRPPRRPQRRGRRDGRLLVDPEPDADAAAGGEGSGGRLQQGDVSGEEDGGRLRGQGDQE